MYKNYEKIKPQSETPKINNEKLVNENKHENKLQILQVLIISNVAISRTNENQRLRYKIDGFFLTIAGSAKKRKKTQQTK